MNFLTTVTGSYPRKDVQKDTLRKSSVNDQEALDAFHLVTELEGIMPALETAHAFAYLDDLSKQLDKSANIVINVSGRGDKDINTVAEIDGIEF